MHLGIRMDYEERSERALYRHNHNTCLLKLFVTSNLPSQFFFLLANTIFTQVINMKKCFFFLIINTLNTKSF